MDTSSLLDLVSSPIESVEGEGSEEEEGEELGDDILNDLGVTPLTVDSLLSSPIIVGEGDEEEEEGEDIGDILDDLKVQPITSDELEKIRNDSSSGVEITPEIAPTVSTTDPIASNGDDIPIEKLSVGDIKSSQKVERRKLNIEIPKDVIQSTSNTFLDVYNTPISKMKDTLTEFSRTQQQLLRFIELENEKLNNLPEDLKQAISVFEKAPLYQSKIEAIQREMVNLSERVSKAKQRANKLHQKKKQDDKEEEIRRKKLREKEELLTAKPAGNIAHHEWSE